jgi:RNA polymerase sigma factor (sigma-70 family)
MTTVPRVGVLEYLRQACVRQESGGLSDGQLLECFLDQREEAAFEALLRRHGPMVLGVCRRLLGHAQDAEDAFQATFLVLARKAASVVPRDRVANWLYGVAYRTALAARTAAAKRRAKEREAAKPEAVEDRTGWELRSLLDRELSRLPGHYRLPILLCDLEGKTRAQAARQLGWPEGTLSCRLARARRLLAGRLACRGLAFCGGLLAVLSEQGAASARVPGGLAVSTIQAATRVAAGQAATPGGVPARVAALAEGVLRAMKVARLKIATAAVLLLTTLGVGASLRPPAAPAQGTAEKALGAGEESAQAERVRLDRYVESLTWLLTGVDVKKRTIGASWMRAVGHSAGWTSTFMDFDADARAPEPLGHFYLRDVPVAEGAKVFVDGREGRLEDLKRGMRFRVRMATGKAAIVVVDAYTQTVIVKATDAERNTLTVVTMGKEVTVPVARGARILLAYQRGEYKFTDLKPGMRVDLQIGVEGGKIAVTGVRGQLLSP